MQENVGLFLVFIEGLIGTALSWLIFHSAVLTEEKIMFFGSVVFVLLILSWIMTVSCIEYGRPKQLPDGN